MHVEVHIPGAELIESLRSRVQCALDSAIGRHADQVVRVSVRLSDFCGDGRGGVLTSCRVEAEVEWLPRPIVSESLAPNPYRAIDNAVERLSRTLHREVRRREQGRPYAVGFEPPEISAPASRPVPAALSLDPAPGVGS